MAFISTCLLLIGAYWIAFSFLTFLQGVKLNNIIIKYEELGTVRMAQDARFLACRANVVVAFNGNTGRILAASKLRPAFILIPHRVTELRQLEGRNIYHLDVDSCDVDQRTKMALRKILEQIRED